VVVSFSNVAASGGYYISCLGDSIFAQPNSITGSIGVFALIPNVQNLYTNKLGLKYETVQTGNESNLWRPDQPLNPSQSQKIQSSIDQVYDDFISVVSKGRKMPKDSVHNLAQGRVYSGIRAKEIGLIDDFGDLDRAVRSASKMAKVKEYRIDNYPQQKPLFEEWLNEEMGVENSLNEYLNQLGVDKLTIKELRSIKSNQGMQCRMPWSIEIH
jgi:protease-4